MKRNTILRLSTVMMIIMLSLVTVVPAYADAPLLFPWPVDYLSGPLAGNQCPFEISVTVSGTQWMLIYFDKDGQPLRLNARNPNLKERWSSAYGKSIDFVFSGPTKVDYTVPLIWIGLGVREMITLPHYGVVYAEAGHRIEYQNVNGEWVFIKHVGTGYVSNWAAICEYLGP